MYLCGQDFELINKYRCGAIACVSLRDNNGKLYACASEPFYV